jgi:exonuclease VII large subunit
MRILLALFLTAFTITTYAQKEIKLEQLKDHIGDSVKVQGIISGVRFLESSKNTPTFINVGGAYPNQLLTVVIWGNVRNKLAIAPSTKDAGNKIIVSGKVELYKEQPQIVIKNPKQFEIVQDAQGDQQ